MEAVRVAGLPDEPLTAAARFYADHLPAIEQALADRAGDLVIVFAPADYTHRGWRLAAVQQLARDHAPARVNAIAADEEQAIAAALDYLDTAPGITGQYLPLDGTGASALLSAER